MKRLFALLVIAVNIFSSYAYAEDYNAPVIYVNNEVYQFNGSKPIVRNHRVLVPINSGIFEKVGADVQYDIINRESVIRYDKKVITNYMQELDWYNNGIRCYISDVRTDYLNSDAYIPLRVAMECIGKTVSYNSESYSTYIE